MTASTPDPQPPTLSESPWLALVIGNSRLHWGAFVGDRWLGSWHTPHLNSAQAATLREGGLTAGVWQRFVPANSVTLPRCFSAPLELWVAGVVRSQLDLVQGYPLCHTITLDQIPLPGRYPTLGVDRAINLLGAGTSYGWPTLVVDCGTALTFTAGTAEGFYGGAILPGWQSQLRALHTHTDALPLVEPYGQNLPPRWANTTQAAMLSGVFYGQLATIHDFVSRWWNQFPLGQVVLTGGDSHALAAGLSTRYGTWATPIRVEGDLMFWGLQTCRQRLMHPS